MEKVPVQEQSHKLGSCVSASSAAIIQNDMETELTQCMVEGW